MAKKVYKAASGAYYIKLKSGKTKFVKKPGRKKTKRNYKKNSKLAFWRRG